MGMTKTNFVESTKTVAQEMSSITLQELTNCGYTIKKIASKVIDGCFCIAITYLHEEEVA